MNCVGDQSYRGPCVMLPRVAAAMVEGDVCPLQGANMLEVQRAGKDLLPSGCSTQGRIFSSSPPVELRSFLVVGDPLCATTHTDLWLRARTADCPSCINTSFSPRVLIISCARLDSRQKDIKVQVIHNASARSSACR